jgi:hypothetical protein
MEAPMAQVGPGDLLTAMLHQMLSSPASVYVLIGLSVLAYVCEIWPKFPSKFIPIMCILGGPVAYPLFCRCNTVPPEFPNCYAVLAVNGLVAGLGASAMHQWLIKWILTKMGPPNPPSGGPGPA